MLRIIRIAVALIAFFVIPDFVGASNGGDVEGSGQRSDTAGSSASGNSLRGHEDSGNDRVPRFIRESGITGILVSAECIGNRSLKTVLTMCPCSDDLRIFI